jgi:RimJ/RimL family protein N-acetyltransferase
MTARCLQPPTGPAAEAAAFTCACVPVLETERLRLRAPRVADLPLWLPLYSGPEAVQMGGPFEDPDATAWEEFAYYTGCWMLYGHGLWTIELGEHGRGHRLRPSRHRMGRPGAGAWLAHRARAPRQGLRDRGRSRRPRLGLRPAARLRQLR